MLAIADHIARTTMIISKFRRQISRSGLGVQCRCRSAWPRIPRISNPYSVELIFFDSKSRAPNSNGESTALATPDSRCCALTFDRLHSITRRHHGEAHQQSRSSTTCTQDHGSAALTCIQIPLPSSDSMLANELTPKPPSRSGLASPGRGKRVYCTFSRQITCLPS